MALCTSITRDGALVRPDNGWGWWHVMVMADVARREHRLPADTPILTALSQGTTTVSADVGYRDPADGEVLILKAGDRLDAWRDR